MTREKEIRVRTCEVRAEADEDGRVRITGRAIPFNELSDDLGGFYEEFAPGAARLAPDLRANFDHQTQYILGRTKAKTLEASVTDDGVHMVAFPPDTQWARDLKVSMDRGDIDQMSFEFYCNEDSWAKRDGMNVRTVLDADVVALSVVAVPAYSTTSAQARSMAAALEDPPAPAGETGQEDTADEDDAGRGLHKTPVSMTA